MGDARCGMCDKKSTKGRCFRTCCNFNVGIVEDTPLCCDKCINKLEHEMCGKCGIEFCSDHGEVETQECCGMALCGSENDEGRPEWSEDYYWDVPDESGEGCYTNHKTKDLSCGHTGCNFYKNGCRTCIVDNSDPKEIAAIIKDKKRVEGLLEKSLSESLRETLDTWLDTAGETASVLKDRKRGRYE